MIHRREGTCAGAGCAGLGRGPVATGGADRPLTGVPLQSGSGPLGLARTPVGGQAQTSPGPAARTAPVRHGAASVQAAAGAALLFAGLAAWTRLVRACPGPGR